MDAAPGTRDDLPTHVVWWVVGVTLLGLALRVWSLGSDLWLDEMSPVINSRNASVWQVFVTRFSFNNHLLNNLLVKLAVSSLGESEWAIRLPAMLWGTATIPVMYWLARQLGSRQAGLWSALLLAVSYHHIFFSQDARGYTAYVFLSLVSSGLLVRALRTDSSRAWFGFVVATGVNFAALLLSGFVFAAHVIVAGLAAWQHPTAQSRWRSLRRSSVMFGAAVACGALVYAPVVPQMVALLGPTYKDLSSGYSAFSFELVAEVARGLSAGFGPGLIFGVIPFLGLAVAGFVILIRRDWLLVMALCLPLVVQAAFFITLGLVIYPRVFILALPLTIVVAVQAISSAAAAVSRALKRDAAFAGRVTAVAVLGVCGASMAALPGYYRTPKQPYRASLAYVEASRQPTGIVIEIHYAAGMKYYRERDRIGGGAYFQARTLDALDQTLAAHPGQPVWLVTTFARALRTAVPDLDARIKRDWEKDRVFRGTVGDGDITVWRPRQETGR